MVAFPLLEPAAQGQLVILENIICIVFFVAFGNVSASYFHVKSIPQQVRDSFCETFDHSTTPSALIPPCLVRVLEL